MCNACGFYCCASDVFDRCGCEHCPDPGCWDEDDEDEIDADDFWPANDDPEPARPMAARHRPRPSIICEACP